MVSERDRVNAHPDDLIGEPRGYPDAVRSVFAVHYARVDLELRADRAKALFESPPSGGAHDVGDEQDAQGGGA